MAHARRGIYGILDKLAQEIIGGLQLHYHEAPAIRAFDDIGRMPDSMIGRHPQDFDLIRLGWLTLESTIEPEYKVVLSGTQWQTLNENGKDTTGDPAARERPALASRR